EIASHKGFVDVLQWWKDSGLKIKYDAGAMDEASASGDTAVLQWWKESGLELRYEWTMSLASGRGYLHVLQ
ncbi:hypothetical protein DFJ73DRAFT_635321, partial [Zopfochytrium polystomum]